MKKKLLAALLALVLMLGMLPAVSAAEVVASGHGWNVDWVLTDDGTLTISGSGYMSNNAYSELNAPWSRYMEQVCSVVINEGVLSIAEGAFCMYENLTSVIIPESVTKIGRNALGGCVNLTAIHIPASVKSIGYAAFAGCGLTAFTVAEDNPYFMTLDGVLVNKEMTELIQVPGGRIGSYAVPESIQTIYRYTFTDCDKLTEVVFPDHLTQLPEAVLYGLESLTSVKLPASLTEIPVTAFYGCANLTAIEIPEGVTGIGMDAFRGCASLKTVVIPASVEIIHSYEFCDCSSLTDVVFRGSAPILESGIFYEDTLTAWYPAGDESWIEEVMQSYYGNVTWKSYEVLPFTDVLPFQFFHDSVAWAVDSGITNGLTATTFGPNAVCNRAQVVTFLWRAAGSPEPETTEHPFADVEAGSFYEKAVLWAVEQGITTGTDATHFSPNMSCNRATVVTFLWRAAGSPAPAAAEHSFADVQAGSFYETAVLWAVENGITNGLTAAEFGPNAECNRAQVVTFLYRAYTA